MSVLINYDRNQSDTTKLILNNYVLETVKLNYGRLIKWIYPQKKESLRLPDDLWKEILKFLDETDVLAFAIVNRESLRVARHSAFQLTIKKSLGNILFQEAIQNGRKKRHKVPLRNIRYFQMKSGQSLIKFECLYKESIPFVLSISKYQGKILFDWQNRAIYFNPKNVRAHGSVIRLNARVENYIRRLISRESCGLLLKDREVELDNITLKISKD